MEDFNNVLKVKVDGVETEIHVLDIIESKSYNKTFIIYTVGDNNDTIFASILNEKEDSYTLDQIQSQDEIDYINYEIDRVANEIEEDNE